MKPRRFEPRAIHVFLILVAALAFYARTIDNFWVKDDINLHLMTKAGTDEIHWPKMNAFLWPDHMTHDQYWRPLPVLTGFLNYAQWKTNPAGYHIVNTLMHALVGVLVYFLFNRLTNFATAHVGFFAGLLIVLNPINPEAIIWVTQRMVLMCAMFYLLAMLAWLKGVETGRRKHRVVAYVCMLAAMASKETGATLPAMFVLLDLFWAPAHRAWKARIVRAAKGIIPAVVILALYLVCRQLLFGRAFDITYSMLEPEEYARQFRVFERMGESLTKSLLPVNEDVFSGTATWILSGMMLLGYGLAVLRGLVIANVSPVFRKLVLLCVAMLAVSFVPTLMIFWVDRALFNGRFFYQPAIPIVVVAVAALWLPGLEPPRPKGRILAYVGTGALVLAFAISLGGGLTAFDDASNQIDGLREALGDYAAAERAAGADPVVVALITPSVVKGVPTLEYLLEQLMQPPLSFPGVPVIPLLDVHFNQPIWYEQLAQKVAARGYEPERLRYIECLASPVGIRPVYAARDGAHGTQPPVPATPRDGTFLSNASEEPEFRFTGARTATRYQVRFVTRKPDMDVRVVLIPGRNCDRDGETITWRVSRGDAANPQAPDLWKLLIQQFHTQPLAILWRVEAWEGETLLGVSKEHRLMIFNVLEKP